MRRSRDARTETSGATVPLEPRTGQDRIAIVGLGYVGLPVAIALGAKFPRTIGFDVDAAKVRELQDGVDRTGQIDPEALASSSVTFTDRTAELAAANVFVVAVPTPVDANRNPDLAYLASACRTIGPALRRDDIVVFESTVYPGVTEDVCGPLLAEASGLRQGHDFKLAYSPERINPGDPVHTFERIVKVVAAEDEATLRKVADIYGAVVDAGVHAAPSIRVAEAAKVIENTQRDLNIALVNELAIIFDRLGIRTADVLAAARTKWNFLPFTPGLVGGHCIGVDPYYLTAKAEQAGYHPQVILAGRRINDGMGTFVANKCVKLLARAGRPVARARVGILGLTFKENVPDLRNSRVPDIAEELAAYDIDALIHDPIVDAAFAENELGVVTRSWEDLGDLDALILAVPHRALLDLGLDGLLRPLRSGGIFVDVKSVFESADLPDDLTYWSL